MPYQGELTRWDVLFMCSPVVLTCPSSFQIFQFMLRAASVFQPIAPAVAACYNPRNDCDGDDVGRSQLAESRRMVRGGSQARAQSPPESPGTLSENKAALIDL